MGKNPFTSLAGGRASRAEVYGLFIAAIVLIGGGVSGAIAITSSGSPVETTATESAIPSTTSTPTTQSDTGTTDSTSTTTPEGGSTTESSPGTSQGSVTAACEYTQAEQNYYNSIRATKQAAVDQAQAHVDNVHSWIASNTAHLEELLASPYRPIEVFQWHPDGTPMSYRIDSNEEIAFERQRIQDNQSELVRAEDALRRAIADRDLIPGC